jgi:DNA repair protein REV1
MEPSSIKDMSKAGRDRQKAFGDDSFHVYMARKIDMQRRQFGCMQLPPSPLAFYSSKNMSERLHAQNDGQSPTFQPKSYIDKGVNSGQQFTFELIDSNPNHPPSPPPPPLPPIKKFGVDAVVKRLQRRHGVIDNNHSSSFVTSSIDKMSRKRRRTENTSDRAVMMLSQDEKVISSGEDRDYDGCNIALPMEINRNKAENCSLLENPIHTSDHDAQNIDVRCSTEKQRTPTLRPDLFFFGIVVLINGYTDPDAATLQRLLQKHGGDVEKYETTRITHIIAERLSHAKANVYKKQQRNPKPVCHTKWITDSVQAYKLLPYQNYILEDVKKEKNLRSVASMFQKQNTTSIDTTNAVAKETDSTKDLQSNTKYRIDSNTSNLNETYNSKDRISNEVTIESISTDSEQPRSKMSPTSCSNLDRYDGGDHDKAHPSHSLQHTEESAVPICQELHSFTRSKMEERYIHGNIRTVGTDPNFLESFFASSRLSFIGSYRQRQQQQKQSPSMKRDQADATSATLERFIFHVDMDCFFASVVLRKYPQYKDQPVAISHNSDTTDHGARQLFKDSTSECATCNYEARKFGIKKGMFLSRAKVLCPNLIVLPYDYEGYEEVSDIVSDILDRHAAEFNGYVEHVSCDEAYMEIFIPSNGSKSPNVVAADVAEAIRTEISSMTQCTASVGVAANKFLAKLATDHIKPNRSFVMDDCRAILKTVKLRDLYGIGYKMGQRLEDEGLFSVHDIWDLGDTAETELCQILGVGLGKKIYGYCYGKDDRGMQASERKTIGAEVSIISCLYILRINFSLKFWC